MAKRRRVEGLLEFPRRIIVEANVLGRRFSARIGGQPVQLMFPVATGEQALGPDSKTAPSLPDVLGRLPTDWGHLRSKDEKTGYATYAVSSVRTSFLVSDIDVPGTSGYVELDSIAEDYMAWWSTVNAWLSAWHEMPSQLPDPSEESLIHVVNRTGGVAGTGVIGLLTIVDEPAATIDQITGAIRRSTRGQRISLAHQLILSSRNAIWSHDYRLAAIDAGSAAEVALASAIRQKLMRHHVKRTYVEAAIEDANGVIGLYDQYVELIGALPVSKGAAMNKLALVRNSAAHAGKTPTETEARDSLNLSSALVNSADPLPAP